MFRRRRLRRAVAPASRNQGWSPFGRSVDRAMDYKRATGRRLALESLEDRSMLAVITVDSILDGPIAADGNLTLREAITAANTNLPAGDAPAGDPGLDTIEFNIPGGGVQTIAVTSSMPEIIEPLVIDGYTQPGASANTNDTSMGLNTVLTVELDGGGAGLNAIRFATGSDGSEVRGLSIGGMTLGVDVEDSEGVIVAGNFIGVRPDGVTANPNNAQGVVYQGVADNGRIGGLDPADRNLISGNGVRGMTLTGSVDNTAVQGNLIGTDASGANPLGNGSFGLGINDFASENLIGHPSDPAGRNVISGNGDDGIIMAGDGIDNNSIQHNYIGTDITGLLPLPNAGDGIRARDAVGTNIGGPAGGNLIAFNAESGVAIVRFNNSAVDNRVEGNTIHNNGTHGVVVIGSPATGNRITRNSIFDNTQLGIDLGDDGLTLNDPQGIFVVGDPVDVDEGANRLQNFPNFPEPVFVSGSTATIAYNVVSDLASSDFPLTIEFFLTDSANQEGQTFIGSDTYNFIAPGAQLREIDLVPTVPITDLTPDRMIVATATDLQGNTSEFSLPASIVLSPPPPDDPGGQPGGPGQNDTIETSTLLGSEPAVTLSGRIQTDLPLVEDIDFYKYTANKTGKLIVNTLFTHADGDIDLRVRDMDGNVIAESLSATDNEKVVIPVVTQEMYFIEVVGAGDTVFNSYVLEVENFEAPAPAFVDLTPASDTGASNSDNITLDNTPTFLVQADLTNFRDMGITLLDQGTIDPNNDGDAADATDDGAGVFVTLVNINDGTTVEGFANQLGPGGFLWSFTPAAPIPAGDYFVSAAVQMVDGQQDPDRSNGRAQLSDPLFITILDPAVGPTGTVDLLTSSDTGMFNDDYVTSINQPAFGGTATAGTTVRLFANGELVGTTTAGSDASDGVTGDGQGIWEITSEPLADGGYDISIQVEDLAGTVVVVDPSFNSDINELVDVVIDTEKPNTPLLNLLDDTGEDLTDEITFVNTPEFSLTTTDPNVQFAELLYTDNLKFRIYDRFDNFAEVLIYDSAVDGDVDNVSTPGDMFTSLTVILETLPEQFAPGGFLTDGTHNLKLEVEDRAGNISDDFLLEVVVDTVAPLAVVPNLQDASDSGMFNDDNVTNIVTPAFDGVAEVNTKVRVFAQAVDPNTGLPVGAPQEIGLGTVGSDGTDGVFDNGLGSWEVTVEPLVDGVWDITTTFEDWAGNVSTPSEPLRIVVDTESPNTPFLELLDDSGRNDDDNVTKINTPEVSMTTSDPNVQFSQVLFTDNFKFRLYDRFENTAEVLIYDSATDGFVDSVATPADMFTALTIITEELGPLADGVHNLKLEVEDRAGNISPDFILPVTIDTVAPPTSFGLPAVVDDEDGLAAESDSGVTTMPMTFADRITNDTTPRLWGRAEADAIVSVYLDLNGNGVIDLLTDAFLGQTVAVPFDGNDAFPDGYWEVVSALDLNEIVGLPKDGLRSLLVSGEDVAGNPMPMNDVVDIVDQLDIFIDTQGPQIEDVIVPDFPAYDVFDPKPSENGPTPLIDSIQIDVIDQPDRLALDFLYEALKQGIAEAPGNYAVVGDHVGLIPIESVTVVLDPPVDGQPATASITLNFFEPLPDDRFTLTVSDNLVDPAGNNLDGESNANQPLEDPTFPTGDGVPGGSFVGRFTVDSRPEIAAYIPEGITIDINGNFVWDPATGEIGDDATNVDLTFTLPLADPADGSIAPGGYSVHDLLLAGRFAPQVGQPGAPALGDPNGFDQLAAYGNSQELGFVFRWIIDTNSDGVVNPADGDIFTIQPTLPNFNVAGAIPIAGNFDGDDTNGDEIGLYYAGNWALDTNHNYVIDAADSFVTSNLFGTPIVGDFDGNGVDDLGVFNNDVFYFDLSFDPVLDAAASVEAANTINWGFPGVLDRPVAADMDQDGIDDIGLWVPRANAQNPEAAAEWYFLISGDPAVVPVGSTAALNHPFEPVPFGNDLYAEFGNELAAPLVGNFDPPVAAVSVDPGDVTEDPDFDGDNDVDLFDLLALQRGYGMADPQQSDGDANASGTVDDVDQSIWGGFFGAGEVSGVAAAATAPSDEGGSTESVYFDGPLPLLVAVDGPVAPEPSEPVDSTLSTPWVAPETSDPVDAAFTELDSASQEGAVDSGSDAEELDEALADAYSVGDDLLAI